jgi:hypothetical protein
MDKALDGYRYSVPTSELKLLRLNSFKSQNRTKHRLSPFRFEFNMEEFFRFFSNLFCSTIVVVSCNMVQTSLLSGSELHSASCPSTVVVMIFF